MSEYVLENHRSSSDHSDEDLARATLYGFLARLLSMPPDRDVLGLLGQAEVGDGAIGRALLRLREQARLASPDTVADEYHNLFIGLGRGELVPYASYYLTGFLQEKPLAKLRKDMASLGAVPKQGAVDPEDHAASVLEIMSGLIAGKFRCDQSGVTEHAFFKAHIVSWMPVFFGDLKKAKSARLYGAVGELGLVFLEVENSQFQMAA